jgi:chromate transporter
MIYLQLLWSFFQVGLFSIGGGYAALPQIQHQVITANNWLTLSEFADVVALSQMTPGPIAINAATFVGMKMGGPFGAAIATFGCVLPSCIIVMCLAFFYAKYKNLKGVQGVLNGLRPAVVAMIASASLVVLLLALFDGKLPESIAEINMLSIIFLAVCLLLLRIVKPNPIFIITGAGAAGILWYFIDKLITFTS